MNYDPKIIDDYIKSMEYQYFQDFCDRLLSKLYPQEFTPVRAGGSKGDMKNDGYCFFSRIFFQAHATRGESANKTKGKIQEDLEGCLKNWEDVKKFVYITNDTLTGDVENFVDSLRPKYPNLLIETWGNKKLASEICKLSLTDIEFVIDRKIITEVTMSDSEVISTKFLITSEYNLIKEISENDLSNFPFENPLLFENQTIQFLRKLIKDQDYRHTEIENFVDIDKDLYTKQYPDAQILPVKENEFQFFYHKRIPNREELKSITKDDNISQYLLSNDISEEKISEILTCYEGECAGAGRFEELYQIRPLYAQFLVIKNISNAPIKLKDLTSNFHDGVLYKSSIVSEGHQTKFPEFIVEPSQNIIIPIGIFLSQFQELTKLKQEVVTSTYVPNQIQHLELGAMEKNHTIEFIGPRFSPRKINFELKKEQFDCDIHEFSFDKVYWVDRHWQCGSCPHLFFIQNGELKYQGEIFSVKPNQIYTERFSIPDMVSELIIAELEQEVTYINYFKKNETIIDNQLVLKEGEAYSITVSPYERIEIKGKYELNSFSNKTLPIKVKCSLIERFKKTYIHEELKTTNYV